MEPHEVPGNDRGAVTVEAAIAVSALVIVVALCLAGVGAVVDQMRCTDAAREAARLIARGDRQLADRAVAEIAPAGARLDVEKSAELIRVQVSAEPAGGLLPMSLTAEAFAVGEPGAEPAPETATPAQASSSSSNGSGPGGRVR